MDSAPIARACTLVMAVSALLLAAGAPPALAGEFVVASCQADAPNYSTDAFAERSTQSMTSSASATRRQVRCAASSACAA